MIYQFKIYQYEFDVLFIMWTTKITNIRTWY